MARKAETGIEYFPINADIVHNPKVKLVVAEFGSKTTWAVLLPLYCKIYREKGYWIDWHDEDSKLLFAQDECKIELSVVNEVVNGFIRRSLFDKGVFEKFGVLTSDRIQENYLIAKARCKIVPFIDEFAVKNEKDVFVYKLFENVDIIDLNVNIIHKKVNIGTQNKKENKNKKENENEGNAHTPEEKELFKKFNEWLTKNTPRVKQMKEPLSIDDYLKLRSKLSKDVLCKLLIAMQNRGDLLKKYVSAYLTILNWSKREDNSNDKQQTGQSGINEALKSAGSKAQIQN